ncbi:MAG: alpha amylase C-terminal domain-containing protein [Bacteroidetes bacterium]|nr:alpha amylase C-terminal domain-containing protein [Bacteroidota bacterium]MBU1483637.1 alpha amylase C-terminal domain-containing protein [Bacteroidota bacterium]MBU2046848.1 alpha amylase C-terminal domain-containing protein [Bacteroidota bacterium]MBU2268040.1 alpha amylase C-terminal domain-containing protein [Bacteroidota bacterium]MBU2375072.1 alpha amylase C-terminal domain-containing protein [Bacteroidota bacterium]
MENQLQEKIYMNGMGAILHESGVFFRVWAPHAQEVFITGDFNNWNQKEFKLDHEDNGYFGSNVSSAKVGNQYKFVIQTEQGNLLKNDPYAREMTNSAGNSVVYDNHAFDWGDDESFMPYWNEAVIYELHLGTFNVKEEGKPGDFLTLKEKLPYLKELGINVIEIMPPFEFPGGFSWGYNPSYPFAIESEYGGPDALKELVKAAHVMGIAVMLDAVYNHFGPSDLDLWQFDGWSENGKGGIYFYNDWKSQTPWGDTRPDYGREEVRKYIRDNAMMWLEEFHVDGLRMDMIPYIRNVHADENPDSRLDEGLDLLRWINKEISEKYPYKLTVAEDLHQLDWVTDRVGEGDGLGFGSQWDATFVHPVRKILTEQNDENRSMDDVVIALTKRYSNDYFRRVIYTESHDEVANGSARVAEEIANGDVNNWFSKKRASLGVAMVLTAPGIPMLFQGQELLEDKWFSDTDPIDWKRLDKFNGYFNLHKDLISLRLNKKGFTNGLTGQHIQIIRKDDEQKIVAFQRWKDGGPKDTTVIILNFADSDKSVYRVGFPEKGLWKIRFNSDWKGYDEEFGDYDSFDVETQDENCDGFEQSAEVSIAPYTAIILSKD